MEENERIAALDFSNEVSALLHDALTKLDNKSHYLWFLDQLIAMAMAEEENVKGAES